MPQISFRGDFKRKIFVILLVVVLVFGSVVSASAYKLNKDGTRTYYLYKDFDRSIQQEDGTWLYRFTVPLSMTYWTRSDYNTDPIAGGYGGTVTWTPMGMEGDWVDFWLFGGHDGVQTGSWSKSVLSLDGFQSNSKITIGYSISGANVSTDHHDVWMYYIDSSGNLVDKIQYSNLATSSDGRRFLVEVPILTYSQYNTVAINLQIDDIIPAVAGSPVTIDLNGVALSTTGTSEGYIQDIIGGSSDPILPEYSGDIFDFVQKESALLDSLRQGLSGAVAFVQDGVQRIRNLTGTLATVMGLFLVNLDLPFARDLLIFGLSLGVLCTLLNIPIGAISAREYAHHMYNEKARYNNRHNRVNVISMGGAGNRMLPKGGGK